jgi:hypothetical protein
MSYFKIVTDRDGSYDDYPKGSRYRFNSHGMLIAINPEGDRRTYSPTGWLRIEQKEHPPPEPPEMAGVRVR